MQRTIQNVHKVDCGQTPPRFPPVVRVEMCVCVCVCEMMRRHVSGGKERLSEREWAKGVHALRAAPLPLPPQEPRAVVAARLPPEGGGERGRARELTRWRGERERSMNRRCRVVLIGRTVCVFIGRSGSDQRGRASGSVWGRKKEWSTCRGRGAKVNRSPMTPAGGSR